LKILSVIGARPQFVKAAVVSKAISTFPTLHEVIVHTGQHYDLRMSDIFFNQLALPIPKYQLAHGNLENQTMIARILEDISKIIQIEKPDFVLTYGDTNSTAAAALAAAYSHIPLAHIEAGLRSYNPIMLEETNRILTDRLSQVLFCPTQKAISNLISEGFDKMPHKTILQTGDVMFDLCLLIQKKHVKSSKKGKKHWLCTIHRAENTDHPERLEKIIEALNQLNDKQEILMIGHPRTLKCLNSIALKPTFNIIDPQGYLETQQLIATAEAVITDSGGLQKEAFFHKKPCIVLRPETEWTELVAANCTALATPDAEEIEEKILRMKQHTAYPLGLFGNGDAGLQIASYFSNL
jgi:UDP-GlcNAc3NAcA epimerase